MVSTPVTPVASVPPYRIILKALQEGSAIPFLGVGASIVGRTDGDPAYLPSGSDLARSLARDSEFPSANESDLCDLSKVSSYYVDVSSRDRLRRELRSVFVPKDNKYRCNDLHRFLAAIAQNMLIVTTNYDTLLEQAFIEARKPYDLVVYPADNEYYANAIFWWRHGAVDPELKTPQNIDIESLGHTNVIYKIHGSVREDIGKWDSFVITEEDYIDFLSRMENAVPPAFSTYFASRSFLFLGYGLRDWNLRVLLKKIRRRVAGAPETGSLSQPTSWALLLNASPFERKLWDRRGVDIYDMRLEDFVTAMRERS